MSLLGYCYYYIQDYVNASDCYEQLTALCPDQDQYKLYYAQSLFKCGLYAEALKISASIESKEYISKVMSLQAAIKYAEDDIKSCVEFVERYASDDPMIEINKACILFKVSKIANILHICVSLTIYSNQLCVKGE